MNAFFGLVLIYGTLVEVHTPLPTLKEQFYQCNMQYGKVVDVTEKGNGRLIYTVRHECELGFETVLHNYDAAKIRPTKVKE